MKSRVYDKQFNIIAFKTPFNMPRHKKIKKTQHLYFAADTVTILPTLQGFPQ